MEIRWGTSHTARLRQVCVGWDGTEAGAPCYPPDWETEPDDLHLLRIAAAHGVCPTGTYRYRRPPADHEYSPFVANLTDAADFDFTGQHRALLARMSWELSDPYDDEDIPGADPNGRTATSPSTRSKWRWRWAGSRRRSRPTTTR